MKRSVKAFIGSICLSIAYCVLSIVYCVYAAEETLVLETYYPSPYGVYNELRLFPRSSFPTCGPATEGVMYYDLTDHTLKVCTNSAIPQSVTNLWALSSNNLYPSNTNWNVGIGTTSPSTKLEVASGILTISGSGGLNVNGGGQSPGVKVGSYTGSGSTSTGIGVYGNSEFQNNVYMATAAGNVGIGTTSPHSLAKLDVSGPLRANTVVLNGGGGSGVLYYPNTGSFYLRAVDPNNYASSQERLFVGPTGRVGIGGTTNPGEMLDVVGGRVRSDTGFCINGSCLSSWSSVGGGNITINGPVSSVTNSTFTFGGSGVSQSGTTFTFTGGNGSGLSGSGSTNYISKWTGSTSLGNSQIYDTGSYVGIGTASPQETLHVNGDAYVGGNFFKAGILSVVNNALNAWSAQGGLMAGFSNGMSVGMGMSGGTPGVGITNGNTLYGSFYSSSGETAIGSYRSVGFTRVWSEQSAGFAGADIHVSGRSAYLSLRTLQQDRLFINSIGNVGIGTTAPSQKLHVNGGVWAYDYWIQNAYGGAGTWASSAVSDRRLKKEISPISGALNQILRLRGVNFKWADSSRYAATMPGVQTGMIAQEVEEVFPDWVVTDPDGNKALSIKGFEGLSVEALRELKAENDALKEQVESLEKRIESLEQR